jgi:serine/threonine-protein kinase RsbW
MPSTVQAAARLNIRLVLPSEAEDVQLARELLSGVAEAADLDPLSTEDVRTAVTEACNNVVQHAYDGAGGPIELDLNLHQDALDVTVRDHGGGMRPWIRTSSSETLGIGLMVIKALAESVEFRDGADGGLEVQMRFATPGLPAMDPGEDVPPPTAPDGPSGSSIAVSVGPVSLAAAVLPRLLSAIAARAHFSTDRISDLHIVGDAIAARVEPVIQGGHLCVQIVTQARLVVLSISPLTRGGSQQLQADGSLHGVGGVIDRLADGHEVVADDTTEMLVVRMRDQR